MTTVSGSRWAPVASSRPDRTRRRCAATVQALRGTRLGTRCRTHRAQDLARHLIEMIWRWSLFHRIILPTASNFNATWSGDCAIKYSLVFGRARAGGSDKGFSCSAPQRVVLAFLWAVEMMARRVPEGFVMMRQSSCRCHGVKISGCPASGQSGMRRNFPMNAMTSRPVGHWSLIVAELGRARPI